MSMSMICLLVHEYAYTTQPPPTRAICPLFWGREPLSRDRIPSRRAVQGASANIAYAPHTHLLEPLTVQRASVRLPPALAWLILVTALAAACPRRASRRAPSVWLQRQCGTRPHTRAHTLAGAASVKGRMCGCRWRWPGSSWLLPTLAARLRPCARHASLPRRADVPDVSTIHLWHAVTMGESVCSQVELRQRVSNANAKLPAPTTPLDRAAKSRRRISTFTSCKP